MAEEPCQCSDCQRFYKEHDRLIREFPTFKHQQELNWASIQSFRTLCNKVTDELAPDPLNIDRLILNRLFHQTPDSPDKKNIN